MVRLSNRGLLEKPATALDLARSRTSIALDEVEKAIRTEGLKSQSCQNTMVRSR